MIEPTWTSTRPEMLPDLFEPALFLPRSGGWRTLRDEIIAAQPWCSICRSKSHLVVHHLLPFHIDKSKELDKSNLMVLCETPDFNCHFVLAHFRNWSKYNANILNVAKYLRGQFGWPKPKPSYPI